MNITCLFLVVLGPLFLSSCSAQQAYGTGQAWQRNQCHRLADAQEPSRCLAGTNTSHDEYKRQAEATKNSR